MGASDSQLLEETRPATSPAVSWPLLARLPAQLAAAHEPAAWRELLRQGHEELKARFIAEEPVEHLVHARAALIDAALREAWRRHCAAQAGTLVAVGGYGRGELHPASDVDILILTKKAAAKAAPFIESFVRFLWDIGLEIGHSVRTVRECFREAKGDVTVATNLMETRLLAGDAALFKKMRKLTGPRKIWPAAKFFAAKREEQTQRHLRFDDTAYNLEPNIKEGPGGLRDIQTISWVVQRYFQ